MTAVDFIGGPHDGDSTGCPERHLLEGRHQTYPWPACVVDPDADFEIVSVKPGGWFHLYRLALLGDGRWVFEYKGVR